MRITDLPPELLDRLLGLLPLCDVASVRQTCSALRAAQEDRVRAELLQRACDRLRDLVLPLRGVQHSLSYYHALGLGWQDAASRTMAMIRRQPLFGTTEDDDYNIGRRGDDGTPVVNFWVTPYHEVFGISLQVTVGVTDWGLDIFGRNTERYLEMPPGDEWLENDQFNFATASVNKHEWTRSIAYVMNLNPAAGAMTHAFCAEFIATAARGE